MIKVKIIPPKGIQREWVWRKKKKDIYVILLFEKSEMGVGLLQENSRDIAIFDPQTPELASNLQDYESKGNKKY